MIGFSDLDRFMWSYARRLAKLWDLTRVEIRANSTVYVYSRLETPRARAEFYSKISRS